MENDKQPHHPPRPFTLMWMWQEFIRASFMAGVMFLLSVVGIGLLQSYTLPDRMAREAEQNQKKVDEQIKAVVDASLEREADMVEQLETMKKQYSESIAQLKSLEPIPTTPNKKMDDYFQNMDEKGKKIDPEKSRMQYLQQHQRRLPPPPTVPLPSH